MAFRQQILPLKDLWQFASPLRLGPPGVQTVRLPALREEALGEVGGGNVSGAELSLPGSTQGNFLTCLLFGVLRDLPCGFPVPRVCDMESGSLTQVNQVREGRQASNPNLGISSRPLSPARVEGGVSGVFSPGAFWALLVGPGRGGACPTTGHRGAPETRAGPAAQARLLEI